MKAPTDRFDGCFELRLETGVGDVDECPHAFRDRATGELGHTVLGDDGVDVSP